MLAPPRVLSQERGTLGGIPEIPQGEKNRPQTRASLPTQILKG